MKIITGSTRSLLFVAVVLCGQVKRVNLCGLYGSRVPTNRILNELIESELLVQKKILGSRIVRLKMPEAQNVINVLPALDDFYRRQTDDHHFTMTPPSTGKRKLKASTLSLICLMNEISINGITIRVNIEKDRSKIPINSVIRNNESLLNLFDSRGHVTAETKAQKQTALILKDIEIEDEDYEVIQNYTDRIKNINKEQIHFFSARDVKNYADEGIQTGTLNINGSRSFGHIFGAYNSYAVYFIEGEREKYQDSTERRYRNYIEAQYLHIYGKEAAEARSRTSPKGECLVFYESETSLAEIIKIITDPENTKTFPMNIYSKSYAVPVFDERLLLITKEDWKKELLSQLFTIGQIESAGRLDFEWCDAIVDDNPTIELHSMDINKILETKKLLSVNKDLKLCIYCKEKDRPLITEAYETQAAQINFITE